MSFLPFTVVGLFKSTTRTMYCCKYEANLNQSTDSTGGLIVSECRLRKLTGA